MRTSNPVNNEAIPNAGDLLMAAIGRTGAPVVVGLDPNLTDLPGFIKEEARRECGPTLEGAAKALTIFNKGLIDAVKDVVPAVKPQMAYYEQYGWAGVRAFEETVAYAKASGLIVIGDVKRNDIGSTAAAYADGILGTVELWDGERVSPTGCDWATVNGYLGSDCIKPFVKWCGNAGKGIFVLVRTSNPSARELQDLKVTGGDIEGEATIYARMGLLVKEWGLGNVGESGWSSVGAVVGATYPEEAGVLRKLLPNTIFLVPGYGAQGAGARDVLPAFDAAGKGAIVNSSRGIMYAYRTDGYLRMEEGYAEAARAAAIDMAGDISRALDAR